MPVPVYGGVPPVAVTVTSELSLPQLTGGALAVTESTGGSLIVTVALAVQPCESVT